MSIRTRLITLLSIVLIVAFVSTSLISYLVSKQRYRAGALDETLPLISNNILSEVQRDLMMPIHVSSLMANDTFLKDWALAGEEDPERVTKYLKEIKGKYGFFTAFFVSEQTGRYYDYDGILKTISVRDTHDVWYYAFKERGKLEYLATVDELTRVANRRQFLSALKIETTRSERHHRSLGLLMIDADHFKAVNDTYGHAVGDRTLKVPAETIQGSLRASDLLGRLGGEEFGVILPETDTEEGTAVAERIRAAVQSRDLETDRGGIRVTVSIGVSAARSGDAGIEALLHRADSAMYRAKANGRNRVEVQSEDTRETSPA